MTVADWADSEEGGGRINREGRATAPLAWRRVRPLCLIAFLPGASSEVSRPRWHQGLRWAGGVGDSWRQHRDGQHYW
jgi:hypothetical protein